MPKSSDDLAKLLLRLTVGGLMLFHGIAKLAHGIAWMGPLLAAHGLPEFIQYGVILGEVVAPVLLVLGYRTRISALVVAFDMVIAFALVHSHQVFTLGPSGGWAIELPAFYFLASLVIFFAGPGKYSVAGGQRTWG